MRWRRWREASCDEFVLIYLATQRHLYPFGTYLETWGRTHAQHCRQLSYQRAFSELPDAQSYIFSDFDRLKPEETKRATQLWEDLWRRGVRLLNHPRDSLTRYPLLCTLYTEGINRFRPYRLDHLEHGRFPMFLRRSNEHFGPLTELLYDAAELEAALGKLREESRLGPEVIAVEYVDVRGEDGVFRKYSAFNIGGQIIPRHVLYSEHWVQKFPSLLSAKQLSEERQYLDENPHEQELKRIFELANIDYGRIDYGVLEGKLQVWEINCNPYLLQDPSKYTEQHMPNQRWFAERVASALSELLTSNRSIR
jgi:hypothetical protein